MKRVISISLACGVSLLGSTLYASSGSNVSAGGIYAEAEADTVSDHIHTLDEHIVTAIRPYQEVIPSQRLEGKELQNLTAHSVADALRYFSGIQVKDYGGVGGIKTIDVRGMGTNHTGVYYDGIQLGNAQNGQIDLGRYSLDNIEEISIYNGQKSEIFQPARDFASASSVYIRTRRPSFASGKRFNLSATMRAGSFGLLNPSVRLDYRFSRRVTATASVEYTYANGRYKFRYHKMFSDGTTAWDTTAVRRNGMVHALRAEATVFGTLDRGRWNLKAYYYDSSRGIPGAIVNNVWKNSQKQWDRNFFLQGGVQHASASGAYEWMVNAKYARDHMRYLNPDTTLMYLDNSFNQQELYLSTTHRFRIVEGWDVSAAVDYQYNTLDASLANFSRPNRNTLLAALATAAHWRGLKAQASFLLTEVADKSKTYSGDTYLGRRTNNFHRLTPAIFLGWTPFEGGANDLALRAFYKRIFRMPTFNDLYYTDIGNADLKPEYATQYDFGATYTARFAGDLAPQLRVGADLYYNNIDDKIIAVPKGTGQYRWMMMNIGEVHTLGLDLNASLTLSLPADILLNTRLTYSYQRARDFSDPTDNLDEAGTYKGQIAYIPLHSGSAIVEGQWRGFTLNYSFIYVGERYHNSSNILANYEQPWYTHDIAAHYAFPLGKVNARVSVEVNNLLNQQYEIIQNYPMPGRNFKFIFRVDL